MQDILNKEELFQHRHMIYVSPTDYDKERGYRASIVFENVSGYYPTDWYWGHDLQVAEEIAAERNKRQGLTEEDQTKILCSSMFKKPVH